MKLIILLIFIFVNFTTFCSNKFDDTISFNEIEDQNLSLKSFPAKEKINTLNQSIGSAVNFTLQTRQANISIESKIDKKDISIDITKFAPSEDKLKDLNYEISSPNNVVMLRAEIQPNLTGQFIINGTVPSTLPVIANVNFGSILIKNTMQEANVTVQNGSLKFLQFDGRSSSSLNSGSVILENSKGNIDLKINNGSIIGKDLDLQLTAVITKNGNIDLNGFKGALICNLDNGSANFTNVSGNINCHNKVGFISGNITPIKGGSYVFTNENGSVNLKIPYNASLEVKISGYNATISSDFKELQFSNSVSELTGKINEGQATLTISASNGTIALSKW